VTPELAALIVNFNAGDELGRALRSIADEMKGRDWEAVVVDNASVDGSAAVVLQFAPQARLISNSANVGFGRGINQGLAASVAPLVLIINPDCRLEPGALGGLRAALDRHPSCAIAGPRILDPDGAVQGSARGDPDMFTGLFGRASLLRRLLPGLAVSRRNVVTDLPDAPSPKPGALSPEPEARVVDWVSGACMLARRDALASVDGFDERYFLYWEDADLCRRLRARGHEIRHVPGAVAVHRVGHSSRTARAASIRAFHASAYLYYATHVAPGALNPKRHIARLLLALRCRWQLRSVRSVRT
jgi:GT2 family glycosyltransferase